MDKSGSEDNTNEGQKKSFLGDDTNDLGSTDIVASAQDSSAISSISTSDTSARQSTIVTARGTADGLIIRLDGRVDCDSLRSAMHEFLLERKSFVNGQAVSLEWIGAEPDDSTSSVIEEDLKNNFSVNVKSSEVRLVALSSSKGSSAKGEGSTLSRLDDQVERITEDSKQSASKRGLFGGIDDFDIGSGDRASKSERIPSARDRQTHAGWKSASEAASSRPGAKTSAPAAVQHSKNYDRKNYDPSLWDDADTRLICQTLRSGQKIETEHSLVVIGDVNSGAELIAGGDIIVLGALRGVAHAGAFDETGGGRFIFALDLDPTQLRIGSIISRGAAGDGDSRSAGTRAAPSNKMTNSQNSSSELARIDGNIIVVEPFSARAINNIRR